MTDYLELEDVVEMVRVAGLGPIRDLGLLEAALARPRTTLTGADAYPTLGLKAAALLQSLVKNHALIDGNKRIGWLATVVFVGFNGHRIRLTQSEAFDLVWAVADSTLADLEEIAGRLVIEPRGPERPPAPGQSRG